MDDPHLPGNLSSAVPIGLDRRVKLPFQSLLRLLYVHNPFYAISAALVFWGLESSFSLNVYTFQMFALMGGLIGYTLILSLAAFVVIRIGKVWDDGRSLLLLVVLMLLAISISFDGALTKYPRYGTVCSIGGLLFSLLVTEGLLWGLKIRLHGMFRFPYYLLLSLFFLYPVALRWTVFDDLYGPGIQWALLAFPSLAAIVCLRLLPAVRCGRDYVRENGTPWAWPWYPWTLFFMMGLGVCGRSYYLCMSMHLAGGFTTIFGPWFLVPFLLAVNVLLLEGGLVAGSVAVVRAAMLVPVGLLALALIPPSGKLSMQFVHEILLPTIGTGPLCLTTFGVAAFYAWAAVRRASFAVEALSAALLLLSVIGPDTGSGMPLCLPPQAYPILGLGATYALIALRRPSVINWFAASCCGVAGATLALPDTNFTVHQGIIPVHLLLAATMLLGAIFSGRFARGLQHAAAVVLLIMALTALSGNAEWLGDVPPRWLTIYPAIAALVALGYGWLVRNRLHLLAAAATIVCWLGIGSVQGYRQLRTMISGLDYIGYGAASLLVAMLISLGKTGIVERRLSRNRGSATSDPTPDKRSE